MAGKKNKNGRFIASTLVTLLIVGMLIISGPASAVTVSISGLSGSITQGASKTFTVTVEIEDPDKFVPISNITLNIIGPTTKQWTFNPISGAIIDPSGDTNITVNVTSAPSSSNFGYGYGYGVDTGYGYNFGYGYGYGYGYGQGGGSISFTYQVNLSTTNMDVGDYTATAYLNTGKSAKANFASTSASFTISAPTSTPTPTPTSTDSSGSSGGGGGGGSGSGSGGVVTSEPYSNIAKAERQDMDLIADMPVTYTFTSPEHGIYEIAITGKENENGITIRVEALKGTSKIVMASAPGIVYINLNLWAGTKRIKEAIIRFKVENSWLDSNKLASSDIKMVKWDGSKWIVLETKEKTRDSTYTYYEAKTDSFSVYAITGLKGGAIPTAGVTPSEATATATAVSPAKTIVPEATKKATGFEAITAIFAIALLVASLIRDRKRR